MSFFSELKRRNVLRVAVAYAAGAWLIIQVVETLFPVFGLSDDWVRLTVIVLSVGFVPVIGLAWVYEWTPQGLKLDSEVDAADPGRLRHGKKLDRAIIAILALAVGYFSFDKFVLEPIRDADRAEIVASQARTAALEAAFAEESIVVLPFSNLGGDPDDEYFSDGLSEELLNLLGKVSKLRVISRSSAFAFKGSEADPAEIAERLDVAHVLQGTVLKAGDRVRISANLIDTRSDTQLWAETYERNLHDVFAIQDDIAANVLKKLELSKDGSKGPSARETDTEAYTLFLQARYLANQFTAESLERAAAMYEASLGIDPDYARAWSGLGWVYANQASSGHVSTEEALDQAREATFTALALDPDNARAYANVGWIAMNYDNDLALAARHYGRALSLEPNGDGIVNGAAVLTEMLGRTDEAVVLHEYSIARDPVDANRHANLAVAYITAGRYDDAIAGIDMVLTLSPQRIAAHHLRGLALLLKGEPAAALESFEREFDEEYRVKGRALALHDLGRHDQADAALTELREKWGDQWPSEVAHVYAWRGDADAAFEWLERSMQQNETGINEQALWPLYEKVRDDPRWSQLLERWGHTPEQLASIRFDVELPQ